VSVDTIVYIPTAVCFIVLVAAVWHAVTDLVRPQTFTGRIASHRTTRTRQT